MGLFLPQRWKRQPQGPVRVDRSNPLGARASGIYTPSVRVAQPGTVVATPIGLAATGNTDQTFLLQRDAAFQSADVVSVFCYLILLRTSGSPSNIFATRGTDGGNGNRRGFELGIRAGSFINSFTQFIDSTGNRDGGNEAGDAATYGSDWVGVPLSVVFDVSRDTLSRHTTRFRRAGSAVEALATGTSTTVYGSDTPGVNAPRVVGSTAGASGVSDVQLAIAFWQIGASTATQRAAWFDNPWQILAPQRATFFSLPGTSGPVLSLPTVIDITSTSVRPRVTITY